MADVLVSAQAQEWLADTAPDPAERIKGKRRDAAAFPEHYLQRLSGSEYYRLQVGDYRVIIDWRQGEDTLFVVRIGHRDGVYE
jgi:mRNA interferase RelE/StbE